MRPFSYTRTADPDEAVDLVSSQSDAAFVAGGTELLNWMRDGLRQPDLVVDINELPLTELRWSPESVRIGALARMADVARDRWTRLRLPLLSEALLAGASGQVRNMASIGGNLMQRTRCWYFRDAAMPCNTRDPGSGCPAIEGENRWHAILGGSDACIKVHPSDLAVALTALDATVLTRRRDGGRRIPIEELYRLPGTTPHLETLLEHGELITGVDVPLPPARTKSAYVKVRDRRSFEFAVVSVAVLLRLQGRDVQDVRIALGGVAPKPWRSHAAENVLRGSRLDDASIRRAGEAAVTGAVPRTDNAFKVELVRRTLAKALRSAEGAR